MNSHSYIHIEVVYMQKYGTSRFIVRGSRYTCRRPMRKLQVLLHIKSDEEIGILHTKSRMKIFVLRDNYNHVFWLLSKDTILVEQSTVEVCLTISV